MKITHHVKRIVEASALTYWLYSSLTQNIYTYNFSIEVNPHYWWYIMSISFFITYLLLSLSFIRTITLYRFDFLIVILLFIGLISIVIDNSGKTLDNEHYTALLVTAGIYLVSRFSDLWISEVYVPTLISISFLIEISIGLRQALSPYNHTLTGSFNNSGIFSIYLCACLPFVYKLIQRSAILKYPFRKRINLSITFLVLLILLKTTSRTAIVMLSIILICYVYHSNRDLFKIFCSKLRGLAILLISGMALCFGLFTLITMKPDSSIGRWIIWKISFSHLTDNILTGIGIGKFSFSYPFWQIKFVSSHAIDPIQALNIDESHVTYNEYLQLFLETGLVGFSVFIWLLVLLFKSKEHKTSSNLFILKAGMISILFAGLTSYPFHCNALLFMLAGCTAHIVNNSSQKKEFTIHRQSNPSIISIIILLLLITNIAICFNRYRAVNAWEKLRENILLPPAYLQYQYDSLYTIFYSNGKFLLDYSEHLNNWKRFQESVAVIERCKTLICSERLFVAATTAYLHSDNLGLAILNARQRCWLLPYKFTPKYELVKLYVASGDTMKAKDLANEIISMPVKVASGRVNTIKLQMLQFINE